MSLFSLSAYWLLGVKHQVTYSVSSSLANTGACETYATEKKERKKERTTKTKTNNNKKQTKQQQQKKKRKKNPEQKQQNKLVWPNVRCGACNTGEQDTLTLCTPSPSNRYSQNSENEYVNINAHTQKMNIMSMWMPTCEAQFDSMY